MKNIERERVFLLKKIPSDIMNHKMIDINIGSFSFSDDFDVLKIRQKGDDFELVKKTYISEEETEENSINITKEEFNIFFPVVKVKHSKKRVFYKINGNICEIDFYLNELNGYVRVEVEFSDLKSYRDFTPPDWFGDEITDINHEIYAGLGVVTFEEMKKRFEDRNIKLNFFLKP